MSVDVTGPDFETQLRYRRARRDVLGPDLPHCDELHTRDPLPGKSQTVRVQGNSSDAAGQERILRRSCEPQIAASGAGKHRTVTPSCWVRAMNITATSRSVPRHARSGTFQSHRSFPAQKRGQCLMSTKSSRLDAMADGSVRPQTGASGKTNEHTIPWCIGRRLGEYYTDFISERVPRSLAILVLRLDEDSGPQPAPLSERATRSGSGPLYRVLRLIFRSTP